MATCHIPSLAAKQCCSLPTLIYVTLLDVIHTIAVHVHEIVSDVGLEVINEHVDN